MKIFLTIEFIALLIWIIAWGRDVYNRSDYSSPDGGWTTKYKYVVRIRQQAYTLSYVAGVLAVIGVIYKIWF